MNNIIVVGGGAGGLMAAIAAAREGASVTIFEKNEKLGKKIYITGKGRCNITNDCDPDDFFAHVIRNPKFMYSSYYGFMAQSMMDLLKGAGLAIKTERGNRVFPVSDHASDVTKTLEKLARAHGVKIELNTPVVSLLIENPPHPEDGFYWEENASGETKVTGVRVLRGGRREDIKADSVILATGGLSYPTTGSSGDGYKWAQDAGHKIMPLSPSLVPMLADHSQRLMLADMAGLSLKNVRATLYDGTKKIASEFGEMLYTHTGVSGPIIISMSAALSGKYFAKAQAQEAAPKTQTAKKQVDKALSQPAALTLEIDYKPALSESELDARLVREFDAAKNKSLKNVMHTLLPESAILPLLNQVEISPDSQIHDITKTQRTAIIKALKGFKLTITGLGGFDEAIITRGGICVKEIDPSTMHSKLAKNLYFAGEIIDIDAYTGGFNLQLAWSTGYAAGVSAAQRD